MINIGDADSCVGTIVIVKDNRLLVRIESLLKAWVRDVGYFLTHCAGIMCWMSDGDPEVVALVALEYTEVGGRLKVQIESVVR